MARCGSCGRDLVSGEEFGLLWIQLWKTYLTLEQRGYVASRTEWSKWAWNHNYVLGR